MRRSVAPAWAAALTVVSGCFAHDYRSKPRIDVVDGDPIVQMSKSRRTLDHPPLVPLRFHRDPPFRDEAVLGLRLGAPRMYPLGLLDTYEVINAESAGVPFVVARCALAGFVGVFDRRVAGRILTFENSGALWRDMLVLRDRETRTYWIAGSGRAISGALEGARLSALPAAVTTANAWEELLPETLCLDTGDLSAVPLRMQLYARSDWEGISGSRTRDRRFPPKASVFVVSEGSQTVAFSGPELKKLQSARVTLGNRRLTLEWDSGLRCPRAFAGDPAATRREVPVTSMYWFAVTRHFAGVQTLSEVSASS